MSNTQTPDDFEINYDRLWWHVDLATAVLSDEHKGERSGGTFNLRNAAASVLYNNRFRDPIAEKADKYDRLAAEKTERLCNHPEHTLSWQSMNEELEQYQGAVRAPNGFVGSYSAFLGEEDEALVLWVFVEMDWMTREEADAAAAISSNSRYEDLMEKFTAAANRSE